MIDDRILRGIPGLDSGDTVKQVDASQMDEKTFRREHINTNTPVLIKGGLKHWPAFDKWSKKGFLEEIGKGSEVNYHRHLNFSNDKRMKATAKKHDFVEAIDEMRSGINEILFMRVNFQLKPFNKLKEDMDGFKFLPKKPKPLYYPDSRMFIYKGAGSSWHLHVLDETLMCQVAGRKRVAFIPTNDSNYQELKDIFYSDKLMEDDNCMRHMKGRIKPLVADVEAGDALYIPPNWWHGVQPLDSEVGMTIPYCWRSPYHKISNLRYPAVREMYKDAFKKPSLATIVVPIYGLLTMMAQCVHRAKQLVGR
ncbi:MAG: cupin-like domain-containing protein [Algicola sp.]|nr:cupin-like domain-containing protein [Algicola sp.]